jgi:hypothetical protein
MKTFRIKCHVLFVPYWQAVKWRLNRRSHELIAAGAEQMLHYFLFSHLHTTRNVMVKKIDLDILINLLVFASLNKKKWLLECHFYVCKCV